MKIYLKQRVTSDWIFYNNPLIAEPGIYEAVTNPYGAVSVDLPNGRLGIKLEEFEFLTPADKEEWLKVAYPKIPKVKNENDS